MIQPKTERLDGRNNGSNPAQWVKFRVSGFSNEDSFKSRYGSTFKDDDYNGVVNFHGDTPASAIDDRLDLWDANVLGYYKDILIPSATYETRQLPEGQIPRPKVALKRYDGQVNDFFLYHDNWQRPRQ